MVRLPSIDTFVWVYWNQITSHSDNLHAICISVERNTYGTYDDCLYTRWKLDWRWKCRNGKALLQENKSICSWFLCCYNFRSESSQQIDFLCLHSWRRTDWNEKRHFPFCPYCVGPRFLVSNSRWNPPSHRPRQPLKPALPCDLLRNSYADVYYICILRRLA